MPPLLVRLVWGEAGDSGVQQLNWFWVSPLPPFPQSFCSGLLFLLLKSGLNASEGFSEASCSLSAFRNPPLCTPHKVLLSTLLPFPLLLSGANPVVEIGEFLILLVQLTHWSSNVGLCLFHYFCSSFPLQSFFLVLVTRQIFLTCPRDNRTLLCIPGRILVLRRLLTLYRCLLLPLKQRRWISV